MRISHYVAALRDELGCRLSTCYSTLVIGGDVLPVLAARSLQRYTAVVVTYLRTGEDAELPEVFSPDELVHLGFARLSTGVMAFPDGDEAGDRILAGLDVLNPARQQALDQQSRTSRPLPIQLQPASAASGHYRYVLARGQHYENLPFSVERE